MPKATKPEHFRESSARFYDKDSDKYLPAYPLIWIPSKEIESRFAKHYDVIVEKYAEKYNLLGLLEIGLYNFLQTYARIDRALKVNEFSQKYRIAPLTLVRLIDRLQDCELIERVCRVDHRGHPNDLVLRPPQPPSAFAKGYADKLLASIGKTDKLRRELGKQFPGNDALFSERALTKALGSRRYFAADFHELCVSENYKFFTKHPSADLQQMKDAVLPVIKRFCDRKDIDYTVPLVEAAIGIFRHYGRRPATFH